MIECDESQAPDCIHEMSAYYDVRQLFIADCDETNNPWCANLNKFEQGNIMLYLEDSNVVK